MENNLHFYFYKIFNTKNNKIYIGRTKYNPIVRFKGHLNSSINDPGLYFTPFCTALRKYNIESFKLFLIYESNVKNIIHANMIEQMLIKKYNSFYPNGYNILGLHGDKLKLYRKDYNNFRYNNIVYKNI